MGTNRQNWAQEKGPLREAGESKVGVKINWGDTVTLFPLGCLTAWVPPPGCRLHDHFPRDCPMALPDLYRCHTGHWEGSITPCGAVRGLVCRLLCGFVISADGARWAGQLAGVPARSWPTKQHCREYVLAFIHPANSRTGPLLFQGGLGLGLGHKQCDTIPVSQNSLPGGEGAIINPRGKTYDHIS